MSLFSDINTWDVGKTLEKVENPPTFSRVLPTSRMFISENRDMVNVFYCLTSSECIQKNTHSNFFVYSIKKKCQICKMLCKWNLCRSSKCL